MVIRPGDVNLMTAGRGIVHSERSPKTSAARTLSFRLQTWLALPDAMEEIDPVFAHTEERMLPHLADGGVRARVGIGQFEGAVSPRLHLYRYDLCRPDDRARQERAVRGQLGRARALHSLPAKRSSPATFRRQSTPVFRPGRRNHHHRGACSCHVMLFGGPALGSAAPYLVELPFPPPRSGIDMAKEEWRTGRFDIVPGDEEEFIPLPSS